MLDLRPLVARLVDDLLLLIRRVRIEELHELRGNGAADPPPRRRRARRRRPQPPAKPAKRPKRRRVQPRPHVATRPMRAPEPPPHAEITDPERLLAAAAAQAPEESRPRPAAPSAPEPSPPSGERRGAGNHVALRRGESVARASDRGGVVIRRSKRA